MPAIPKHRRENRYGVHFGGPWREGREVRTVGLTNSARAEKRYSGENPDAIRRRGLMRAIQSMQMEQERNMRARRLESRLA